MIKKTIFLILMIAVFVTACTTEITSEDLENPKVIEDPAEMFLSLDKNLYHSGETMQIDVNINSKINEKAQLKVYGIYSRKYRLNKEQTINLTKGSVNQSFEYNTPSCNSCSGIKAGTYKINAELLIANKTIANQSIDVEIRQ